MSFQKKIQFSVLSAMMASSVMCSVALAQPMVAFDPNDPHNITNLAVYNHSALPYLTQHDVVDIGYAEKFWGKFNAKELMVALLKDKTGDTQADDFTKRFAQRINVTEAQMNTILVLQHLPKALRAAPELQQTWKDIEIKIKNAGMLTANETLLVEVAKTQVNGSLPLKFALQGLTQEQNRTRLFQSEVVQNLVQPVVTLLADAYLKGTAAYDDFSALGHTLMHTAFHQGHLASHSDNATDYKAWLAAITDPEAPLNAAHFPNPATLFAAEYDTQYHIAYNASISAGAAPDDAAIQADQAAAPLAIQALKTKLVTIGDDYVRDLGDIKAAGPELMSLTRTPVQDLWSSLLGLQSGDAATPTKAANIFAALPKAFMSDKAFSDALFGIEADNATAVSRGKNLVLDTKQQFVLSLNGSTFTPAYLASLRNDLASIAQSNFTTAIASTEFQPAKDAAELFASDYLSNNTAFTIAPNASFALAYTLLAPLDYNATFQFIRRTTKKNPNNYLAIVNAMANETLTNGTLSWGRDAYPFPGVHFTVKYMEARAANRSATDADAAKAGVEALGQDDFLGNGYTKQLQDVKKGK